MLSLLLATEPAPFLPHPDDQPFWFSAQANFIFQWHPSFDAAYSGPHSLKSDSEAAASGVISTYWGVQLARTTEILATVESAQGGGISDAFGVAGFTDLDVVRNPTLGSEPYVGRILVHQVIPLSSDLVKNERTFQLELPEAPVRRLDIFLGKLSTVDFFDFNAVATDSHVQFMNWTVDNTGAYDYAADTRGYTYGLVLAYQSPRLSLIFGEFTMPKVANGLDFDFDYLNARAENYEVDWRWATGAARALFYLNHANMGSYQEAIDAPDHDITQHRHKGATKYGFAANAEQRIGELWRAFVRVGWNDGKTESFAYTEVDDTIAVGGDVQGRYWHRDFDKVGVAFVSNGISDLHREYLRLGGLGFLLGDGNLRYGRETIVEAYYTAPIWRGFSLATDLQFIANPGYNQDRGPVWVHSVRAHFEF